MKNSDRQWSLQRTHKVTGEKFYLSPGEVNWISVQTHLKYKTRYGHWTYEKAEQLAAEKRLRPNNEEFFLEIVLYEKVK